MTTHSLFTGPVWGRLMWCASAYLGSRAGVLPADPSFLALAILAGALIASEHLFLDSLTQAGVYYWEHRIAIAHFAYDNFLLNAVFTAAGVILAALAFLR